MRGLRLLATFAAAMVLSLLVAMPALGQYATGLPQGVVAAEVDSQPIDAANTPQTADPSPTIAGRINTGQPIIDIGIGNGEITRFQAEVDAKGRFKAKPPAPLDPGQYGLYLSDALVGNFIVTGDGQKTPNGDPREQADLTIDVARLVPFPADFYGIYPELGLLDGRYSTADDQAMLDASADGDVTADSINAAKANLRDSGWVQRYDSRLAVPDPNDPTRFLVQANSFVIEYKDEARAQAAFGALLTGADLRPDVAVGAQSELTQVQGTTPNGGATYLALRNVFQIGRFVCVTLLADLSGGEPSQDAILSATLTVANRAAQVEAGQVSGAAPKALRLSLPNGTRASYDESYQAIDGQLVPLYDEAKKALAAREAAFTGTYEDFVGGVTGVTGTDAEAVTFAYGSTISSFPTPEDADAWMAALPDLIANDPLPGYAAFDPVSEAPSAGEASAVFAVNRKVGETNLDGYRIYLRVGGDVATLEYATSAQLALGDLQPMIDAQVACLQDGACAGLAALPGGKSAPEKADKPKANADATSAPAGGGVQDAGTGAQPEVATQEPAVRPAPAEPPPAAPAATDASGAPATEEPAIRRASSGSGGNGGTADATADKKNRDKKNRDQPAASATPAASETTAAEPTPTWGGGVRDITPSPDVSGG